MASAWWEEIGCIASSFVAIATVVVSTVVYARHDTDTISDPPSHCPSPTSRLSVAFPSHPFQTPNPLPSFSLRTPAPPRSLSHGPSPSSSTYCSNARLQNVGMVASTLLAIASLAMAVAQYANNGEDAIYLSPSPASPFPPTPSPSRPYPITPSPSSRPPPPSSLPTPSPASPYPFTSSPSSSPSTPPTTRFPTSQLPSPPPEPTAAARSPPAPITPATLTPGFTLSPGFTVSPGATLVPGETLQPTMFLRDLPTGFPTASPSSPPSLISSPSPTGSVAYIPRATTASPVVFASPVDRLDSLALLFLLASVFFVGLSLLLWRSKRRHSQGDEQRHDRQSQA